MMKDLMNLAFHVLGAFVAGLIFIYVVVLLLAAIFLAVACACELWDIYLKDIFRQLRRKRNGEDIQRKGSGEDNKPLWTAAPVHKSGGRDERADQRDLQMSDRRQRSGEPGRGDRGCSDHVESADADEQHIIGRHRVSDESEDTENHQPYRTVKKNDS